MAKISEREQEKKTQPRGIMNRMRDKMPLILIIVIIAFLGTIVFDWGMNYLGLRRDRVDFAVINGQKVEYKEYMEELNNQIKGYLERTKKKEIDEKTLQQLREQVWQGMVQKILVEQEIERLGIKVSEDEVKDWVYNRPETLPQWLKNFFTDSTNVFRTDLMYQTLQSSNPEIVKAWADIEKNLFLQLKYEKLQDVILGSVIVTEGEILKKYMDDNIKASFEYMQLGLNSVTDSNLYAVTEEDLRNYYEEHKSDYKQREMVQLKYVLFPENASPEDSAFMKKQFETTYIPELQNLEDSNLYQFVNEYSETPFDSNYKKLGDLPRSAAWFFLNGKVGDVSNLLIDFDAYRALKILDIKEGDEEYVFAQHILIKFGNDSNDAKKRAEEVFKKAKSGEKFEELAKYYSEDDGTKNSGGELGWFNKGRMVKEFEDACYKSRVGEIVGPVKTNFGYHIIKVVGKSKKEFQIAEIRKSVSMSEITRNALKNKAYEFWKDLDKGIPFDSVAAMFKMTPMLTPEFTKDDNIPNISKNKALMNFAFRKKVGDFLEPVKTQSGYGVYQIVKYIPEGYKNFDSIKVSVIKPMVQREKKFQYLLNVANQIKPNITSWDMNSLQSIYPSYTFATADSVSFSRPDSKIGLDYALYNKVFEMKPGELSEPIRGNDGVYIVKMKTITPFDEADYTAKRSEIYKNLMSTKQQSAFQEYLSNLEERADIIDNRELYM
ncbi:MAG: peptidylprolyl isomerase [Ignavibacteria bacterium]|nr:peptidylprolyl isomerase [Ignavibacteria bacterium]